MKNKLKLKFELTENTKTGGMEFHEVEIEPEGFDASDDINSTLRENLVDWERDARRALASRFVDFDLYDSDSAYLDELDRVSERFFTACVQVTGAKSRDYTAEGIYPNDGGLWSDNVSGVNESEAKFQAAWAMAENCIDGFTRKAVAERGPEKFIEYILDMIEDQQIVSVTPAVPNTYDILQALKELHAAAVSHGIKGPSVETAEATIKAFENAAHVEDSIEFDEDGESISPAP